MLPTNNKNKYYVIHQFSLRRCANIYVIISSANVTCFVALSFQTPIMSMFLYSSSKSRDLTNSNYCFLAHLSQRLIGELIVYPWSGVRPAGVCPTHNFKHLLLRNCLANQSQILCGASLGRGNESLFAASGSHDQDDRHANIW